MEQDRMENLEADGSDDVQSLDEPNGQQNTTPTNMLRIKEQMFNQCVEMSVKLGAVQSKRSCSPAEAERNLADYVSELEEVKTDQFIKTLPLQRMQMWHAIAEKMKQKNPESDSMKALCNRCMALCSQIKQLQQESRDVEDQVTEIQKKRLELKRLTQDKIKEMDRLMYRHEHPDLEKYKAAQQKCQSNLEKYKTMAILTQNVLRGIILACKINWEDDPKIKAIATTLEDLPIKD